MIIHLKNKHTLKVGEFYLNCSIGKNGVSSNQKEGDKKTPKGIFGIQIYILGKIELTNQ